MNNLSWKMLIGLLLFTVGYGLCEETDNNRIPADRYYQDRFPVFDNLPAVQYSPVGSFYSAVPTFFLPNQVGMPNAPTNTFVLPRREQYKVVENELPESTDLQGQNSDWGRNSVRDPGQKGLPHSPNSVYSEEIKSVSGYQKNKKFSSISVRPASENGYQENKRSSLDSSTPKSSLGFTYGPATASDYSHDSKIHGLSKYRRLNEPPHRYSFHGPKKRIYSHKGRYYHHRRSYPKRPSFRKSYHSTKYGSSNSVRFMGRPAKKYSYAGQVKNGNSMQETRFSGEQAESVQKLKRVQNGKNSPAGNDLRGNGNHGSDSGDFARGQGIGVLPYQQDNSLQAGHSFGSSFASSNANGQINSVFPSPNPYVFHGFPGSVSTYQSNQQDLETSETVKIPVAIIRGAHDLTRTGIWGFAKNNRREKKASDESEKKKFHPSKRMSDWIPMVGGRKANMGKAIQGKRLENEKDSFFARSDSSSPEARSGYGFQRTISGNSPNRFSTTSDDSDVITGRMPPPSGGFKRKGSVTDVHSSSLVSDTSDMIVSSVIKFS